MPKLSYPTSTGIGFPILIDASQLERLDEIIDEHYSGMKAERDKRLEAALDSHIAEGLDPGFIAPEKASAARAERRKILKTLDSWAEEKRSITISLSKGRQIEVTRFSEALSHPPSQDEIPLDYTLNCRVGPLTVLVHLVGNWGEGISVSVSPSDSEKSQEIFGALVNWLRDVQAPSWQRLWYKARYLVGTLLVMFMFFALFTIPLTSLGEAPKEAVKEEARKLITVGINSNNQQQALQLLLEIESDYSPTGLHKVSLGVRYWSYVGVIFVLLTVLFASPKRAIGFWRGRELLNFWRFWIRTVTVTIPTLLITFMLLPWLLYWLHLAPPTP